MGGRWDTSNIIILFLIVLFKSLHAGNFYHPGSDNIHLNYDDCSTSSVAQNINNAGGGNVNIKYGSCNPSSVAYSINSLGSGKIYLTFQDSSASSIDVPSIGNAGAPWADNIYNLGSGGLYIKYRNCCSSTSTRAQNLYNQGDGVIDVNYGTCSSSHSNVAQTVYNLGRADIRIVYRNCSSLNPVRTVNLLGSGDVIITYGSCRSYPPKIVNKGSGKVQIKCLNKRKSTAKVVRNTNIETTRNRLQIKYNKESAPDASEAISPSLEELKKEGFPEERIPKRE